MQMIYPHLGNSLMSPLDNLFSEWGFNFGVGAFALRTLKANIWIDIGAIVSSALI